MKKKIEKELQKLELRENLPLHAKFWTISVNHKKKGEHKYRLVRA